MIDLWMFLTVAVIVWGIVELFQYKTKSRQAGFIESNRRSNKFLEEKIERLEQRVGNLETIIVDESDKDSSSANDVRRNDDATVGEPGRLSNSLRR